MSEAIATNEARSATGSAASTAGVVRGADTRRAAWPLLLVVAIVGLNLRPFITGVGPLAEGIRDETGLGLQGLSLLTLVPMLLMGLVGFAGPSLQSAVGVRRSIIAALAVLCVGSLLRLFSVTGWELIGTAALIGCGAAIVQAMFPGVVKRVFPGHVAKVMGLYSAMLMSGGALGAKASPIIAGHAGSWHLGLAWLALPAGLAVLLAAVYLPANEQSESRRKRDDGAVETAARLAAHAVLRSRQWRLFHRHRLAVAVLSGARMGRDRERQPAGGHGHLSGNLRSYPAAVHRTDG